MTTSTRSSSLDLALHDKTAGESNAVKLNWAAPPHPQSITLSVNGKTPPSVPLSGDHYSEFPAGPMQVEATWNTDARDTGYYVTIAIDDKVYARCSSGTSCSVPKQVPPPAGQGGLVGRPAHDDPGQPGRRRIRDLPQRGGEAEEGLTRLTSVVDQEA